MAALGQGSEQYRRRECSNGRLGLCLLPRLKLTVDRCCEQAFMVARGPSALLQLHVHGAYAWASDDDFPPVLQLDFGPARSEAATVKGSVYTREYERATVSLDCNTWSSSFELKSGE